ncbi:MAG: aromatic ring-hydroxylating oxygenase subunit alpha [Candidatus Binataceae bacterium]
MITPLLIDDREAGMFRVNRRIMVDPTIFELERSLIFNRCWLYAGHESELPHPGDFHARRVGGRPIIFVRSHNGTIRALLNSCRHRGTVVCREKTGNTNTFRCFYHSWTYSNDGSLIGVPGEEAYSPAFKREQMGLVEAPRFEDYRGFYFLNFDHNASSLKQYLARATEYFDIFADQAEEGLEVAPGSQEYSIRANWKLLVENSFDGYHPFSTHNRYITQFLPAVGATGPRDSTFNPNKAGKLGPGYEVKSLGNGHAIFLHPLTEDRLDVMATIGGEDLRAKFDRLSQKWGSERARKLMNGAGNMVIFPNLVIVDGIRTVRVTFPTTVDYAEITAWTMIPREERGQTRERRLQAFQSFQGPGGFATPDDVEALEAVQRGLATFEEVQWTDLSRGMKRDEKLITDEFTLRNFWRGWYARMTGAEPSSYGDLNGARHA